MKQIKDTPFWAQVVCIPFIWILAILKLLVFIPTWIVAKCNMFFDNVYSE